MKIKILFLPLLFLIPSLVFAEHVDVEANPPSGIYYAPIRIEFVTTESGAKTFYSFKPEGYPQDAYLYTEAILLKKSSPLIFFSIKSPTNESKIKQNDYVIEYSPSIRFSSREVIINPSGIVDVSIENKSSEDINIGFWQLQSEASSEEIGEGTMLSPGGKYTLSLVYTGSSPVVLRSPDGEERDILQVKKSEIPSVQTKVFPSSKNTIPRGGDTVTVTPLHISPSATDNLTSTGESILPIDGLTEKVAENPTETIPIPVQMPNVSSGSENSKKDIGDSIKISVSESGENNIHPLYIFIFLGVAVLIGFGQFWFRKKDILTKK